MSKIGRKPVEIPDGVDVSVDGATVKVKGPKGSIEQRIHPDMKVKVDKAAKRISVDRPSDSREHKALHGLARATVNNMVIGVTKGYEKKLEINGVGYNAKIQGTELVMALGFSHDVHMAVPSGLKVTCPNPNNITINGVDKHLVGQFAADVRHKRPPEPYNLKGIKYSDEIIRKKAGKTFVTTA